MFSPRTALFVSMHLKEEEEVEELVMRAWVGVGVDREGRDGRFRLKEMCIFPETGGR